MITEAYPVQGSETDVARLHLLRLCSPALPVGAYAYSGGLEQAVAAGWVRDESGAGAWITGVLEHALAQLDVPVLLRLHRAWQAGDQETVRYWSRLLLACRESAELRAEDRHLGTALARLLADLGVEEARSWREEPACTWAAMFALAGHHWDIPARVLAQGYLWSWCENQMAAAVKLIPLGQTAGQRILLQCTARIPACVRRGETLAADAGAEEKVGAGAPALAMASALHESQYCRLFRS